MALNYILHGNYVNRHTHTRSHNTFEDSRYCYFGTNCHCKSAVFTMMHFFWKKTNTSDAVLKSMKNVKVLRVCDVHIDDKTIEQTE